MVERLESRVFLSAQPAELPAVTVSAPRKAASENGPAVRAFYVRRSGDLSQAVRVGIAVGGTATNRVDYGFVGTSVVFPAGQDTVRIAIRPVDDGAVEPRESVTLTIRPGEGYGLGARATDHLRITDNDGADRRTRVEWTAVAPSPIWRCEAQEGTVDGKLYIFGGFVQGTTGPVTRSDVFDPKANTWRRLADLPTRVTHAATAVDGTKIYLAGGWVGWGNLGQQDYGTTDVWIYDTAANTYTKGPSLPEPRGAGVMVKLDRSLHFMSGTDPSRADRTEHWVLDLDRPGAGWRSSVPTPVGRNHVAAAVMDGHVFFLGGQVGPDDLVGARDEFFVWHPSWGRWRRLPDLPVARSHHNEATLTYRGRLITIGGTTNGLADMRGVSSYDPRTGQWTDLTPLPGGRYTGLAAIVDDVIYYSTGGASGTYRGVFS